MSCPKYRKPILSGEVEERLDNIMFNVWIALCSELLDLQIMPDHVHLLVEVDPQFGIHKLIKRIKGKSSRLLRTEFAHLRSRIPTLWTNSYFVSSVGGVPLEIVRQYIEEQKYI